MTQLIKTVPPPAQIRKQHLARGRRYKRLSDRRIFRSLEREYDRAFVEIVPISGGQTRRIGEAELARNFVEVAKCARCGWHHNVHQVVVHGAPRG